MEFPRDSITSILRTEKPPSSWKYIFMKNPEQHKSEQLSLLENTESSVAIHPMAGPAKLSSASIVASPRDRKTIQDLLLPEGLFAVQVSSGASSLDELQKKLQEELRQNSAGTRLRYARSILLWFFWDGVDGLARQVWRAYGDEEIEITILRYLYLTAEPLVGACVSQCLYPLEDGMVIPPSYFERYLRGALKEDPPAKTLKRLKTNLAKLGFLDRSPTKGDRLKRIQLNKTSFIVVFHSIFSPAGPRTIEIQQILRHPFWKYLGLKSEQSVRAILRDAEASGLFGKYVAADQLEQVTTCFSLSEILNRRVRL